MKVLDKENFAIYILIGISCFSKILGFLRDAVLASIYGTSHMADVFFFSLSIPDFFFDMINNTIIIGFIPITTSLLLKKSEYDVNLFVSGTIKFVFLISLVFFILVLLFGDSFVSLFAPGFIGESYDLAVIFVKILVFSLIFKCFISVFSGYLNVKRVFYPPALTGIILDICIIISIFLSIRFSYYLLPAFVVVASFLQFLLLLFYIKKQKIKFYISAPMFTKEHINMMKNVLPALISVSVLQISTLINRALASNIMEGGIAYLNYSSKMSFFAENIVVASLCTVLYPTLSTSFAKNDLYKYCEDLSKGIKKTIFFLIPVSVGLFLLSNPIIEILFKRGSFTDKDVLMTSLMMQLNIIGVLGIGLQTVFTRALFALKKINVVVINSLLMLFFSAVLSILLSKMFGLLGIALATGIVYTLGGLWYFISIYSIVKKIDVKDIFKYLVKIITVSSVMGIIIYFVRSLDFDVYASFVLSCIIGSSIYFLLVKAFKLTH